MTVDTPHESKPEDTEVPDGFRNRAAKNSQAVASFFNISASEDADGDGFVVARRIINWKIRRLGRISIDF